MKKLVLLSLVVAIAIVARGQSKISQTKIILGDALQEYGANNFSKILGKALSTSGNMQAQMEQINASNTTTRNLNINHANVPNTYISKENKLMPDEGYAWKYPNDPNNFEVVKTEINYASYEDQIRGAFQDEYEEVITWNNVYTSQGQNFIPIVKTICKWRYGRVSDIWMRMVYDELINENSSIFPSDAHYPKNYFVPAGIKLIYDAQRKKVLKTGIKTVFTCKWIYQANNESGLEFEDFKQLQTIFLSSESFMVSIVFNQNRQSQTFFSLEIFDDSGRLRFENHHSASIKEGVMYFKIHPYALSQGEYLIVAEVEGEIREKKQEKITIY
jgi:hypothetical protein